MDQYERNKQTAERIQRLRGYETDIPPDMQELWIPPEVKKRYRYKTGRARGYYRDGEKRRFIPRRETWEEREARKWRKLKPSPHRAKHTQVVRLSASSEKRLRYVVDIRKTLAVRWFSERRRAQGYGDVILQDGTRVHIDEPDMPGVSRTEMDINEIEKVLRTPRLRSYVSGLLWAEDHLAEKHLSTAWEDLFRYASYVEDPTGNPKFQYYYARVRRTTQTAAKKDRLEREAQGCMKLVSFNEGNQRRYEWAANGIQPQVRTKVLGRLRTGATLNAMRCAGPWRRVTTLERMEGHKRTKAVELVHREWLDNGPWAHRPGMVWRTTARLPALRWRTGWVLCAKSPKTAFLSPVSLEGKSKEAPWRAVVLMYWPRRNVYQGVRKPLSEVRIIARWCDDIWGTVPKVPAKRIPPGFTQWVRDGCPCRFPGYDRSWYEKVRRVCPERIRAAIAEARLHAVSHPGIDERIRAAIAEVYAFLDSIHLGGLHAKNSGNDDN